MTNLKKTKAKPKEMSLDRFVSLIDKRIIEITKLTYSKKIKGVDFLDTVFVKKVFKPALKKTIKQWEKKGLIKKI